jgi:hypothetical protein
MLLKLVAKLCTWRVSATSKKGHLIKTRYNKQLAEQEAILIIDLSTCLSPIILLSVQYLFTQLQKAIIVYTGVDLQGPINSAFTEPVITAGARTLCCPLRRVPSAGSFHQQTTTLLSSVQELSGERSYKESPYTVITICHFRSPLTNNSSFPLHP